MSLMSLQCLLNVWVCLYSVINKVISRAMESGLLLQNLKSCSLEFFNVIIRVARFGFNYVLITQLKIEQISSKLQIILLENLVF